MERQALTDAGTMVAPELDLATPSPGSTIAVPSPDSPDPAAGPPWRLLTRLAFRFTVGYFTLYVVFTQMLGALVVVPGLAVPRFGSIPPMRTIVEWTAANVFGVTTPLVILGSGSGDKTYDWVLAACLLTMAGLLTAGWSMLARRRQQHAAMLAGFRVFLRFALGASLVGYGAVKAIPLQMPEPSLLRLIEPFGNFSPMGVLWYSIGASRPYAIFTGCVELSAGLLLFMPRTALLGALLALATTVQIFTLNMTYDVPVKLFSFHLLLMSVFLLAPEARRLFHALVLDRPIGPSPIRRLVQRPSRRRLAGAAQVAFGLYLAGTNLNNAVNSWYAFGGGAPKPALYGIWMVDEMSIDGAVRPPLVTDADRWRRVIISSAAGMTFQRMDETLLAHTAKVDLDGKTVILTRAAEPGWKGSLTFDRPSEDRLVFTGDMGGQPVRLLLTRYDLDRFLLRTRGFNWVQEYPFNR